MWVMALDVGTSSTRALCFDTAGRPVPHAEAHVPYEPSTSPDGGVELRADTLLDAASTAIDGCLAGAGTRAEEIQAVGASVFWHGLLGLGADGAPLTPVLTWADTRSAGAASRLGGELDERAVHARTGAPLHAAFFPAKLRWLRESQPDTFRRVRTWCGFGEYLSARVTGVATSSVSMASGTGLMDQRTRRWDRALLDACQVGLDRLPAIDDTPVSGLAPRFAARWPALARARWFPAHGDGACSNLGSDCSGPDRIALNVGTSSALRLVWPDDDAAAASPTPWGLWRYRVDARRSLVGGATSEGGNVLAWCRRVLALPGDDDELERAIAAIAPDAHGLTVLPFLAGERSLGWRSDARAALCGMSLNATPAGIVRGFMEAVACRLALVYRRLAPLARPAHAVVASGAALGHSPAWATMVTDALGVPLGLSSVDQASARGAALLALAAMGVPPAPPLPLRQMLVPDPGRHEVYRAATRRQEGLYANVLEPRVLS